MKVQNTQRKQITEKTSFYRIGRRCYNYNYIEINSQDFLKKIGNFKTRLKDKLEKQKQEKIMKSFCHANVDSAMHKNEKRSR